MRSHDNANRQTALGGSLSGAVVAVAPLEAAPAERLKALQGVMSYALPHQAGLNPVAFRHSWVLQGKFTGGGESHQKPVADSCMMDGNLLYQWNSLAADIQAQLAVKVGCSAAQLSEDLAALSIATTLS